MKNLKITILTMLAIFIATTSLQARENLRVGVIFDWGTGIDHIQRPQVAKKLIKNLNDTFKDSGLSSYYNFQLTKTLSVSFSGGKSKDTLKRNYLRKAYSKYNGEYAPMLTLQIYQEYYKLDLVVAIMDMGTRNPLGSAMRTIKKGDKIDCATFGIVFLNSYDGSGSSSNSKALTDKHVLAHEFGHTFGIQHGKAVSLIKGSSHYQPTKMIQKGASGFGKSSGMGRYGTLMTGAYIVNRASGARAHFFSDKTRNDCGKSHNKPCGDSNANAVQVLKNNASKYGKRSEWYN
jgi:predicted Zn-dependent protease